MVKMMMRKTTKTCLLAAQFIAQLHHPISSAHTPGRACCMIRFKLGTIDCADGTFYELTCWCRTHPSAHWWTADIWLACDIVSVQLVESCHWQRKATASGGWQWNQQLADQLANYYHHHYSIIIVGITRSKAQLFTKDAVMTWNMYMHRT